MKPAIPMFASVDLARRIDTAEARLCAEIARAVAIRRPQVRVLVEEVAGGLAVYTGPSSPTNKMIGVGFVPTIDDARLGEVERLFAERGAPLQAEVSTLADPAFHSALGARGYVLQGFENLLGRLLSRADPVAGSPHTVELLSPAEIVPWADMLVTGFEHPDRGALSSEPLPPRDVIEQIIGDMLALENLRRYVIRVDGKMVAGASLRIDGGIAQLTGSATLPAHRRRGMQTAFLHRRLADAAEAGCELAVVTTAPGSRSQQNAQRQGFSLLYSRAVHVKP
jgi:hypothetical protein